MSRAILISECFVRPQTEPDEAKKLYHLGPIELSMLSKNYIQAGFLFEKPSNYVATQYMNKLRASLSNALVLFYPLAGRLVTTRYESEHSSSVHVDCTMGSGARLIHAVAKNVTIFNVLKPKSDVPEIVRSFFDLGETLVNHDGHTRPLLSVQVTELTDGVFIGFCFNHCMLDGTSVVCILKAWSDVFMGLKPESVSLPVIQKPEFLDGKIIKLPYLYPERLIIRPMIYERLKERYFHISSQSLQKLKAKANTEVGSSQSPISYFQALSALVWICITRARKLALDEVTTCVLPLNLRPRFKPALSMACFGNYYAPVTGSGKVGVLLANSVGWAAKLLQKAVGALDDNAAREIISKAIDEGPRITPPNLDLHSSNVVIGGSPRFPVNECKFGPGKLVSFRDGYTNKFDGKVYAYSSSRGDGVDFGISLAFDTMNALLSDEEFTSFVSEQDDHLNLVSKM